MRKVIAIDFDGSLCADARPKIGEPNSRVIDRAKSEQQAGAALILWTCRCGTPLEDAVNENLPELKAYYGGDCRKVYADEYWDDRAVHMPMTDNPALMKEELREMAKTHYSWWRYVREIVRLYPERSQIPLTGVAFREYMDVKKAVETNEAMPNGKARIQLIRMVHWDKTFTLEGAAQKIPCNRATAARWQRRFFEEVAKNRGIID